ncbi:type I polyketide synthase [Streptomyces zhihengii]|uniref:SDR family NAD(P)-dependent oxidoreductase n=1 Tax=Streptomyces zhihengii TaxID=1818004 RepID=A0ABS2V1Z0_9ACTN|nr:type I polyketide synthase [Streptomyces zhihengii]MBM9623499.1 SDR family NAD(P)-dependent oxidoreductase [Streptomyces zhihengii]
MTTNEDKLRDYLKRATTDLRQARRRISELEERDHEPVAIIGMACRYPGDVRSPEDLWRLVDEGRDAVSGFPTDRGWDLDALYDPELRTPGTSYVREGGFLHDAAEFDGELFGISPREALAMDPQQRILLETTWEAVERAAIAPAHLKGSDTGVFIGAGHPGYGVTFGQSDLPEGVEGYSMTGKAASVVTGRISYTLGLEGPAVTVDTACSSSLVALHLAVTALRKGECSLAVAGGVTVMPTPELFAEFSRQRGLSQDGRCKAFAASADGTGWAEGVGVLLVERLSDARRNGHRVLAVVRGSAVNQDGASNGLTAPNGPSQQRVIRQALANAGLASHQVDAVEAHGTGTTLGDPIEAQALLATYGQGRDPEQPLWLGSLKSNIGHSQAAAGVGGVIKMVMALRHGTLPRTLHADEPTPRVDWDAGAVSLLTDARPWPAGEEPRRAGISSFGVSGTNAHVVIEDAPAETPAEAPGTPDHPVAAHDAPTPATVPWTISAAGPKALRAQAARLLDHLTGHPTDREPVPADVARALTTTRAALGHRAVVVGTRPDDLLRGLRSLADGTPDADVAHGTAADGTPSPVFVFPGQGAQWSRMGLELADAFPVFAASLDACGQALGPFTDWDLRTELAGDLARVDVVQPASWAVMVSLARLWESFGVTPAAVVGHSQGEIAAAVVAGGLSLEDGARIVAERSRVIGERLAGRGGMASVALPADTVREKLDGYGDRLAVAAVNGPSSTVVSGEPAALDELLSMLESDGVRVRRIAVDYASHSSHVESIRDELLEVLAPVAPRTATVPFYSTVTGGPIDTDTLDAAYWVRNLRGTVEFEATVRALIADGLTAFVECSAHPVLAVGVEESGASTVVGSLRRDDGGAQRFVTSLAQAFVTGLPVDWSTLLGDGPVVDLPTYAFQRRSYWLARASVGTAAPRDPAEETFWDAVEREDLGALAASLDLDDDNLRPLLPALAGWRRRSREQTVTDSWRYSIAWRTLPDPAAARLDGHWILVVSDVPGAQPWNEAAERALRDAGARVTVLAPDTTAADRHTLAADLGGAAVTGVLSLLALDGRTHPGLTTVTSGYAATLALVQAAADSDLGAPVWCATRGAVGTRPDEPPADAAQAQLWGLGRVVALEQPRLWGGMLDLPEEPDTASRRRLAAALSGLDGEDQLALRPTGLLARRMLRAPLGGAVPPRDWRPEGTVLVTGGTGALGTHIARWLARNGAPHLLLLSRRGPDAPGASELVTELAESGTRVTLAACDIADRDALAAELARVPGDLPLTAVFHTAAVLDDGVVDALDADRVERVLRVKTHGALNLHELTSGLDLTAFVLFSSFAATFGTPGLGNYAPGNVHLEALAEQRRAAGLPATAVAWGTWAGAGMAEGAVGDRARRHGVFALDAEPATRALQQILDHDETCPVVIDMRWDRFAVVFTSERPSRLLDEIPEARSALFEADAAAAAEDDEQEASELVGRLAALPEADRRRELTELVRRNAALVLGHDDPASVDESRAFRHLGFDSLTAVELRNRLNSLTGLRLPASLVFDYPTPAGLAAHLHTELLGEGAESAVTVRQGGTAGHDDPVVVVGMACRLPGGVASPEDLWRLVAGEGDAISPLPAGRGWDIETLYDPDPAATGRTYVREGGFVHDADRFDPEFFGISPREALAMDPQQRLLLETSWEVLESAGIDPTSLKGSRTGVFAGMTHHNYGVTHPALPVPEGLEGYRMTGSTASVASGRVSYTFGFEGPAVTVDTACSSSLVALHLAVQAIRQGECTMALAGGVTVMASPAAFTEFSRQRGLSPDGRCKAFADAADGFGLAEGVGMLLVERLSDARRNGHRVLAVVRGSAVNQDGASNGLTAPNGPSQQRVIRQALANAGLAAGDVDAVETHGTGTKLGDPIEAQALMATYGRDRDPAQPLRIGSVKSNIGHAQAAAGVAGVIKTVMAMRHGVLPRTLHVDAPSSHIDWSEGAVSLLTAAEPWPETGRPRRAGVSSFGISGTNVHVLFEQPAADEAPAERPAPAGAAHGVVPWALTAGSDASLRRLALRLHAHAESRPDEAPAAVAGALVRSRARLERRAVVVGRDRDELLAGLRAVAAGEPGVVSGVAGAGAGSRPVFVFPGQGAQWSRMGLELADAFPVFAASLDACAQALGPFTDWDLRTELAGDLARVDVVQPASWAVMVSLARLWESFGVTPAAVVGHSQGEIAAAVVAGGLSLEDGARIVAERSRIIGERLAGRGGMASVALPADAVRERVEGYGDRLAVAAVNGPSSTVVSGEPAALDELLSMLESEGVRVRRIAVDYASHSSHVESIRDELLEVLAPVAPRTATVPFYSTVTGGPIDTATLDAAYWVRNLRGTVEFEATVRALIGDGLTAFVECSAHPVLALGVEESGASSVVGSLRRDDGGAQRFVTSLAQAFTTGLPVDWSSLVADGSTVDLPTYPFQGTRFWLEAGELPATAVSRDEVEERFWEAVEREDLESLARSLDLDGENLRPLVPALASWRRASRQESVIDSWRYKTAWRPLAGLDDGSALSGTWLVVAPVTERAGTTPALTRALEARGADVCLLEVSAGDADRAKLAARIAEVAGEGVRLSGVVALWGLDDAPHPDFPALSGGSLGGLTLLQALHDLGAEAPLWLFTRDAVAVSDTDRLTGAAQAQLWGWGRVAALEHPKLWGGLVDLPAAADERALWLATAALAAAPGEDQLAVRAAGVFGRRLVRSLLAGRTPGRTWAPRGTVLVTGGSGGIGGHLARWLARGGAERLVLVSRRGEDAIGAPQLAAAIEELGAETVFAACDIADRDALAAVVRQVEADGPPVTAVVHAAAHIELGMLADTTAGALSEICRAKVLGAENLDAVFAGRDLDAFVLFSSIAGFWGSGDHGAYAAANAHLDTLAERRRARGLRASSVAWGIWDAANDWDERNTEMRALKNEKSSRHGLPLLDAEQAFTALRRIIDHDETVVAVADVDWDRFVALFTMARESVLLTEVPEAARALESPEEPTAGPDGADGLARRLDGLSRPEQAHLLLELVRAQAAAVLGHGPQAEAVDPGRAFREMGFDSLTAVELRNRLASATGLKLPATLVFDHPSPLELAARLRALLLPDDDSAHPLALLRLGDFEAALAASPPDPATRQQLARRLQGLLWSWSEEGGPADGAAAGQGDATAPVDVASASADELFDLIDRGLDPS